MKDQQTRKIVEGINLLCSVYPEAYVEIGYDQEIDVVLPTTNYEVSNEVKDKLVSIGWKNLSHIPYIWEYKVEYKWDKKRYIRL